MRIRMLANTYGVSLKLNSGQVYDLPDGDAAALVAEGKAEPVREPSDEPETAVIPQPELAVTRPRRPRKKG